jgi:hypothetical protein
MVERITKQRAVRKNAYKMLDFLSIRGGVLYPGRDLRELAIEDYENFLRGILMLIIGGDRENPI